MQKQYAKTVQSVKADIRLKCKNRHLKKGCLFFIIIPLFRVL